MKKHILTQEDLDQNPELVEQGYQVGDQIDESELGGGDQPSTQSDTEEGGSDTKSDHDPQPTDPVKP